MQFPKELKKSIENCILSIIYPKEEIVNFFKICGCDKKDLNTVIRLNGLTRSKIIYLLFARISEKPDNGYQIFLNMNNKFLEWTKFDQYYFETINKLDRTKAENELQNLKELQYILSK